MSSTKWKTLTLEEIASVQRGKFSARPRNDPKYYGGETPFIQTGDVAGCDGVVSCWTQTLNDEGVKVSRVFPKGTVVVTIAANIGEVGVICQDMAFPDSLVGVNPKDGIDGTWLRYAVMSKKKEMERSATQAAQANINLQVLRPLAIEVPPSDLMERLSRAFQAVERHLRILTQRLSASKERRKALMQQLLTGKRRFPGFTKPWKKVAIGKLLKEVKRPVVWDDDATYQLLSIRRRSGGLFLREELPGHKILTKNMSTTKAGDFLISKMQVLHGATAMTTPEFDGMHISGSYVALRSRDESKLDIRYFNWLAKTKWLYHQAYISSYGVHIEKMTFNLKDYLKREVELPSDLSEQVKIIETLDLCNREIALLEQQLEAYQRQKRGLMQQLLTGKRRVKVAG